MNDEELIKLKNDIKKVDFYNIDIVLTLLSNVPDIIDELLDYHENCDIEENEANELNIYNGEVHITNNYHSSLMDEETFQARILEVIRQNLK